jgi:hypothetical protein
MRGTLEYSNAVLYVWAIVLGHSSSNMVIIFPVVMKKDKINIASLTAALFGLLCHGMS